MAFERRGLAIQGRTDIDRSDRPTDMVQHGFDQDFRFACFIEAGGDRAPEVMQPGFNGAAAFQLRKRIRFSRTSPCY